MLRHKREGVYDVDFINPYVVHPTNVKDKPEETERNILRFFRKQAHKTRIFFPYVFTVLVMFISKEPGEWKVPLRVIPNKSIGGIGSLKKINTRLSKKH
uniref:Uncharacterized protein n=1 Tax=Leersia perrieri TaxID=77586 RepID=A0A0D9WR87_9ORYZ